MRSSFSAAGISLPAYSYALNNPIAFTDETGLTPPGPPQAPPDMSKVPVPIEPPYKNPLWPPQPPPKWKPTPLPLTPPWDDLPKRPRMPLPNPGPGPNEKREPAIPGKRRGIPVCD